jgi:hypothetical protein
MPRCPFWCSRCRTAHRLPYFLQLGFQSSKCNRVLPFFLSPLRHADLQGYHSISAMRGCSVATPLKVPYSLQVEFKVYNVPKTGPGVASPRLATPSKRYVLRFFSSVAIWQMVTIRLTLNGARKVYIFFGQGFDSACCTPFITLREGC